jgi:2,4-dienoyl-CoA reductase-like NADH-dependent reductase (Old Yellow Enzyme family)
MTDLHISQPRTLGCGLTLPNRLAKAALAEQLADKGGLPGRRILSAYGKWAKGGWGMIMTGEH